MAEVGASAALAGLVFVGVSINLTRIMASPRLPEYALEALVMLLTVLLVSSFALVPGQPLVVIGSEFLGVGLPAWVAVSLLHYRNSRSIERMYRRAFIVQTVLAQAATLPFVGTGIAVLVGGNGGLYWLIPGVVCSFLVTFYNAWVLLIEINR